MAPSVMKEPSGRYEVMFQGDGVDFEQPTDPEETELP
jgi:hypothetical protein